MTLERFVPRRNHPLFPYVQWIWRLRTPRVFETEMILPRANVDIIFNLGEYSILSLGGHKRALLRGHGASIIGLQTKHVVSQPKGAIDILGVSLSVGAQAALFPIPPGELVDQAVESDHVFPELDSICAKLADADHFERQCELLLAWLLQRLTTDPTVCLLHAACRTLAVAPISSSVDALCSDYGLSIRHLRRLFRNRLGISPSLYLRLCRLNQALNLMPTGRSLTEIAHDAYYFDQAHFCRDFKAVAGLTPSQYLEKTLISPGIIFS